MEAGRDAEALRSEGEALLEAHEGRGVVGYIGWAYVALGRAALACGDHRAAWRLAARALKASPNHKGFHAYAVHLWGDIVTAAGPEVADHDDAARHYTEALALSASLHMAPLEALCHNGLAGLHAASGDTRRAASARAAADAICQRIGLNLSAGEPGAQYDDQASRRGMNPRQPD